MSSDSNAAIATTARMAIDLSLQSIEARQQGLDDDWRALI